MEEKFLEILGNIWGTDISYQESQEQVDLIMRAMNKSYELGNKTNDIHDVRKSVFKEVLEDYNGYDSKSDFVEWLRDEANDS